MGAPSAFVSLGNMSNTHGCALLLVQSFPSTYGEALRQAAESTQAAIQGAVLTGIATDNGDAVALHPARQAALSDNMLDACYAVLAALQLGHCCNADGRKLIEVEFPPVSLASVAGDGEGANEVCPSTARNLNASHSKA